MALLDRASGAGAVTSRIDHQDAVAVLVALNFLAGEEMFGIRIEKPEGVVLHCEGRDDLELVTPSTRCLISVKAQSGTLSLIRSEFVRLSARRFPDPSRKSSCALALVGPQPPQLVTFADQLEEVRSLTEHRSPSEIDEIYSAFCQRWPGISRATLTDFYIMLNSPRLHAQEYMAVAIHLLRNVAPLTDYTDDRALLLVSDLSQRFAKARMARGSVTLTEIQDLIVGFALPLEFVVIANAYVRTTYGYLRDPDALKPLKREERDLRTAMKHAMRRYRRATRKWRLMAALLGPVRCIACNHPLMANLLGWTRRGIACPDCGFNPFVSFFYACTCCHPVFLVGQPPTDLVDTATAINQAFNERICENCGTRLRPERLQTRVFQANIPWPPEDFSDSTLIEARKELGWTAKGFRDGKENARDVVDGSFDWQKGRPLPRQ